MHDAGEVRIVKIEAVDEDAVGQGSVAHAQALGTADHRAIPGPAESGNAGESAICERVGVRRQRDADRIKD